MEREEEEEGGGGGKISHQQWISRQDKSVGEKGRGVRSHRGGGEEEEREHAGVENTLPVAVT